MRNSLDKMWRERALLVVLLLLVHKVHGGCPPSSCGKITNIIKPFPLKGDPEKCGDERYELGCENDVTVLYLNSSQYHVQSINYNNYTVRVVDPSLQPHNCSSLPLRSLSRSNFSDAYTYTYTSTDPYQTRFKHIVFVNCNHSVREVCGEWRVREVGVQGLCICNWR